MPVLKLTKAHGLGNDFLVLVDLADVFAARAGGLAAALCQRRTGVGADGLIRVLAGKDGADLTMDLRNADGSPAEMSGNGIRCMAQAVVDLGVHPGPELRIATPGGIRELVVHPEERPGLRSVTVDMGVARMVRTEQGRSEVDVGNPHLVLLEGGQDLLDLGRRHAEVNLELVAVDRPDHLTMRVHERGVGITEACGTGSCAAAVASRAWGLSGDHVTVRNPGGDLVVDLDGDRARLTGPTERIARVEVTCP